MSTYKEIVGQKITKVTSNPGEPKTGQMWYNSTDGKLRGLGILEAFSSASPLSTTREGAGAFGTQTTAVICGGETPSVSGATEEYNGSGFSAGGTMNTARYRLQGSAGTSTAGIIFGGAPFPSVSTATETYNGTAWTTSPYSLNTARWCAGAGIQTSALAFGGGPGYKNNTEEYDGEGWTSVNNMNTSRASLSGAGATAEECLGYGGETSSPPTVATNATESWDGTSWTEVNNLNTARYGGYGAGTQTAAILIGGIVGPGTMQSAAETWDGTNWTSSPASLATARGRISVAGSSTAAIGMAGQTPSITTATEEYNKSTNTITAGAWASGGTYPTNAYSISQAGTQTAAIAFGGRVYPGPNGPTNISATYNGNSWTATPNLNTARYYAGSAKNGSQTAALAIAGYTTTQTNVCEEYNGSSWTSVNNYPLASRQSDQATGTQTEALASGGYGGSPGTEYLTTTCTYDGTNWTALSSPSNLGDSRFASTMTGTQTAAIMFNGTGGSTKVESWNGSTWTEQADMLTPRTAAGSAGTSTDALVYGGEGPTSVSEGWDGTSFSTRPSMANSVYAHASCGTSSAALATAGDGPTNNATEEFTAESTAANITDFTTS